MLLATGWDPVDAIAAIRRARPIAAVAYAEDALDWWHRRVGAPAATRADHRARLAAWRDDNVIDVPRIIRRIRAEEWQRRTAGVPVTS